MSFLTPIHSGLDLSDLVIRVASVRTKRQGPTLDHWQEILLPEGLIVDGEIIRPDEVIRRLKILWEKTLPTPLRSRQVIACLPDRKTFVKRITLRVSPGDPSLAQRVAEEFPQHIPFNPDEVFLDWCRLPGKQPREANVLIAAAPKALTLRYIETIEKAGLIVEALEMESIAIARSLFPSQLPTETLLIVDLGGTRTTVIGISQATVLFSSSLPFSGMLLTRTITQSLHLSLMDAERAKALYGLARDRAKGSISRALQRPLLDFVTQLKEIVRFSQNHFPESGPVKKILICGGGSQMIGFPEFLEEHIQLPVRIGLPNLQTHEDFPRGRLPSFSTAIGLALHP